MLYFSRIKKCLFENNAAAGRHLCFLSNCKFRPVSGQWRCNLGCFLVCRALIAFAMGKNGTVVSILRNE